MIRCSPRILSLVVPVALTAIALAPFCGCVQRRMTIRSNVPGAQVYVDNYEIGRTPASADFIYYGTRNVRLVKDGYETLNVEQFVAPPWYQIPGIDFIAENMWPFELRDERQYTYEMQPQYVVPTTTLLGRAEELRRATPPPAVAQPVIVSPGAAPPAAVPSSSAAPPVVTPPPVSATYPPQLTSPPLAAPPFQPTPAQLPPGYGGTPVPQLP